MKKVKFTPLSDGVLVKVEEEDTTTASGLYVPKKQKEATDTGIVVEVGPGNIVDGKLQKPAVKKGDRILFGKQRPGGEISLNDEDFIVLSERDILGLLT